MKLCLFVYIGILCYQVCSTNLGKKLCNCGLSDDVDICDCQNIVIRPPPSQKFLLPNILEELLMPKKYCPFYSHGENYEYSSRIIWDEDHIVYNKPRYRLTKSFAPSQVQKKENRMKCILRKWIWRWNEICGRGKPKYLRRKLILTQTVKPTPCIEYGHQYEPSGRPYPYFHKIKSTDSYEDFGYESDEDVHYSDNKIPADAVSLIMSLGLAKRQGKIVKEEGLTFGPSTIPKEETVLKLSKDILEHRLLNFNKNVIEMKKYPETKFFFGEDEIEKHYGGYPSFPTYADLGYVPVITGNQYKLKAEPFNSYDKVFDVKRYKPKCRLKGDKFWLGSEETEVDYHSTENEYRVSNEDFKETYSRFGVGKNLFQCDE